MSTCNDEGGRSEYFKFDGFLEITVLEFSNSFDKLFKSLYAFDPARRVPEGTAILHLQWISIRLSMLYYKSPWTLSESLKASFSCLEHILKVSG